MNNVADFRSKINELPKKYHSFYATKVLGRVLGGAPITTVQVSIDTVAISIQVARPDELVLRSLGFKCRWLKKGNGKVRRRTWFLNYTPPGSNVKIKINWSRDEIGRGWLRVEVSLPHFAFGSNLHCFQSKKEILKTIDEISSLVSKRIKTIINLRAGHFSRIDLFMNLNLGSNDNVYLAQSALRFLKVGFARIDEDMPDIYWRNYGFFKKKRKLTYELNAYAKFEIDPTIYAQNILRIEVRWRTTKTITNAAERLGIPYYYKISKNYNLEYILEPDNLKKMFYERMPE